MEKKRLFTDYIFESSWEVGNEEGGLVMQQSLKSVVMVHLQEHSGLFEFMNQQQINNSLHTGCRRYRITDSRILCSTCRYHT